MKSALLLLTLVALAQCHPGSKRETELSEERDESNSGNKDTDTVLVLSDRGASNLFPNRPTFNFPSGFEDDDSFESAFGNSGFFRNPFRGNPFDGFLAGMESAMTKLREQMSSILTRLPDQSGFPSIGKIPDGANTTSTVKVIDGHVVTINETTYTDGDDSSGTVFRVRVVEVKPQNETLPVDSGVDTRLEGSDVNVDDTKEETTANPRSVESVEEFDNNEIPKNPQDNLTA